jgi:hypothetical protein
MVIEKQNTKVITGKARLSYTHLFEKFAWDEEQEPKFSVMLLIPKSDSRTMKALRAAEAAAAENGRTTKFGGKLPKVIKSIIKDGDGVNDDGDEYAENNPERAGHWFMTVNSKTRPSVVDQNLNEILDSTEVYSGCYARASINAYAYNTSGNKGVTFGLNHIQKMGDGDPLGGRSRVEDDFDELDDDSMI